MGKTGAVGAAVVVVVILAVGTYLHFRTQDQTTTAQNQGQSVTTTDEQPKAQAEQSTVSPAAETETPSQVATASTETKDAVQVHSIGTRKRNTLHRRHQNVRESSVDQRDRTGSLSQAPPLVSAVAVRKNEAATSESAKPLAPAVPPAVSAPAVPTPFATLHTVGQILLNGHPSGDSVLSLGDRLEIPENTYASIIRQNSEVTIRPGSQVTVTEAGIQLERGDVLVTTATGISVKTSSYRVVPQSHSPTRFEVLDKGDGSQVTTYEGSVLSN